MTFLATAQKYDNAGFKEMVDALHLPLWKPKYIVLHNTGAPSLKQFHTGRTSEEARIKNIVAYWRSKHWHSGAHLIVTSNNIWVVCELTQDGVHCSCANSASIGIEMVGDYSVESFDDGEGATVRDKTVYAMAILHKKLATTPRPLKLWKAGLHFHRQCTADHHDCPGANVNTADVVKRVEDAMAALGSQTERAAGGSIGRPKRGIAA
jgi:hypothetical protein